MIEVQGDIFDYHRLEGFVIIIPTNLALDTSGNAIMGAGLALELKKRVPRAPMDLGKKIRINNEDGMFCIDDDWVRAMPTKYKPQDKEASLDLIERGMWWLKSEAGAWLDRTFILPRVGTGCGRLDWEVVEVFTADLPENVWLITQ